MYFMETGLHRNLMRNADRIRKTMNGRDVLPQIPMLRNRKTRVGVYSGAVPTEELNGALLQKTQKRPLVRAPIR